MDGMLSQEEINALLNGIDSENSSSDTDTSAGNASSSNAIDEALTPMERDMMGEWGNWEENRDNTYIQGKEI